MSERTTTVSHFLGEQQANAEHWRKQCEEARATIVRLNRRCQSAEAGLAEKLAKSGGSLGRSLANAAAVFYRWRIEELMAVLREAHDELGAADLADAHGQPGDAYSHRDRARRLLTKMLDAPDALQAGFHRASDPEPRPKLFAETIPETSLTPPNDNAPGGER